MSQQGNSTTLQRRGQHLDVPEVQEVGGDDRLRILWPRGICRGQRCGSAAGLQALHLVHQHRHLARQILCLLLHFTAMRATSTLNMILSVDAHI